jgi:transcriptional regulator CtsR
MDSDLFSNKSDVIMEYLGLLITNNGDTIKEIKRRTSIAL